MPKHGSIDSLRPRKPEGSLGRTAQDVHFDSHTAPELCEWKWGKGRLYTYRYTVTTRMTPAGIKMGSDESKFNVSLTVRNKVVRLYSVPKPQPL